MRTPVLLSHDLVICDDGSCWQGVGVEDGEGGWEVDETGWRVYRWRELSPIPGSRRAQERSRTPASP